MPDSAKRSWLFLCSEPFREVFDWRNHLLGRESLAPACTSSSADTSGFSRVPPADANKYSALTVPAVRSANFPSLMEETIPHRLSRSRTQPCCSKQAGFPGAVPRPSTSRAQGAARYRGPPATTSWHIEELSFTTVRHRLADWRKAAECARRREFRSRFPSAIKNGPLRSEPRANSRPATCHVWGKGLFKLYGINMLIPDLNAIREEPNASDQFF